MEKIYIVGAHSRAQTLAVYLRCLYPQTEIVAYLYNNDEDNPEVVDGIPVIKLNENTQLDTSCPVYLGTRGVFHKALTDTLVKLGMKDIRPVTVKLDLELRNKYLKKYYESMGRKFIKIDDYIEEEEHRINNPKDSDVGVYVAKSVYDKELLDKYELETYEKEIQVGAALTDKRLYAGITTDDTGDNISNKNKQFCELTALYWIWKNAKEDVVGLCHYRRHFTLPCGWQKIMEENNIDVILPIPLYVTPTLGDNYRKRHDKKEIDYILDYFKEHYKEEYDSILSFFKGNLYSPCNMFIMKRDVFNEFAGWLFPILEAVVAHSGQKEDIYQNRYPGFLAERLMSYYFEKNRERYKVVFADKNFLN